jgi:bifunctional non-homologous end joining protein LigD
LTVPDYEPMLATSWPAAFDDPGWWFEIKWDGYRAVVSRFDGRVRARSRRGLDLTGPFPELARLDVPDGVAIDGEVVAFDEEGRPSFSNLQRRTGFGGRGTKAEVAVHLIVFDVLYAGESLTSIPYEDRRARLEGLGLAPPIVVPDATPGMGISLFEAARSQGLEGVVGKRLGSPYMPGRRSPDWRKVAVKRRLRAVVGGYLPGEGGRASTFGSILVGLNDEHGLRWIAAVGSGFDEPTLQAFSSALRQMERPAKTFYNDVVTPKPSRPVWVEPDIVVEVEFKEWTHDFHLRAPVYKGVEIADQAGITWAEEGPG